MSDNAGPLILEMHRIDDPGTSPMQIITTALLAHHWRGAAELLAFK